MAVYMCVRVYVCVCKGVRVDVCLSVSSLMLRNKQTNKETNKETNKWFGKPKSDSFTAGESDQMRLTMLEAKVQQQ